MNKPDMSTYRPDPVYLRSLLERAGLSQRGAAATIGVSDRAMRKWLRLPVPDETAPYIVQYALEGLSNSSEDNAAMALVQDAYQIIKDEALALDSEAAGEFLRDVDAFARE